MADENDPGFWGRTSMSDIAMLIAALSGAGGVGYNIAQAAGTSDNSGLSNPTRRAPGYLEALGKYKARLSALNVGTRMPSFQEFLQSGGTAKYDVQGLNQFTPAEAVKLGLVPPGVRHPGGIPYYDPSAGAAALTPDQLIYLRQQRKRRRKGEQQSKGGGGGGSSNKPKINLTAGVGPEDER